MIFKFSKFALTIVLFLCAAPSFAGTETISFPGCSKPMTFKFGSFWDARVKDEASKQRLAANPARQGEIADVFVINSDNDLLFPMVIFSTLGTVRSAQGNISRAQFKDLAAQFDASSLELSKKDKKEAMAYIDRLVKGMEGQPDVALKSMGIVEKRRTANAFAIYSVITTTLENEVLTYFSAGKFYFQDGCLGYTTISLPAGIMGYKETIQALDSITIQ